jgi:hypothetical protein
MAGNFQIKKLKFSYLTVIRRLAVFRFIWLTRLQVSWFRQSKIICVHFGCIFTSADPSVFPDRSLDYFLVNYILVYRLVAKRWLCKQRSLVGNARNIYACNNRRTVFSVGPCRGVISGAEAGSDTFTVALRVVGWLRWRGPAATVNDRPVLSSERAPHKNKIVTVTQVIKIWS